jgi:hypothetical protein
MPVTYITLLWLNLPAKAAERFPFNAEVGCDHVQRDTLFTAGKLAEKAGVLLFRCFAEGL